MKTICLALLMVLPAAAQPRFSFGVIADIQYADKDTAIGRDYRQSPQKLSECIGSLNREKLRFAIQLGDLIDGGLQNLDLIAKLFGQIQAPKYHVLGNHDLDVPRETLLPRLGMKQAYYDFSAGNWTFVVLDGMGESIAGGWPNGSSQERAGRLTLDRLLQEKAPNAQPWNGALGVAQRQWLEGVLKNADEKHQRVAVFCHFPVLAASCRPNHLLWDHREVLQILNAHPSVAVYMNGHDHKGGYGQENGVHFVTLPGMVEHSAASSCQVVDVHDGTWTLRLAGEASGRQFKLR